MSRFQDDWSNAVDPPLEIVARYQRVMDYLGLSDKAWEVRMSVSTEEEWENMDACTSSIYGEEGYFLINQSCGENEAYRGTYVTRTIVHEVLHLYQWNAERALDRAFDTDDNLGKVMEGIFHAQVDKLAYTLTPHIFPDLDPKEDPFEEVSI